MHKLYMSRANQIWANVETGLAYPINTTSVITSNITGPANGVLTIQPGSGTGTLVEVFNTLTGKASAAATITAGAGGTLGITANSLTTTSVLAPQPGVLSIDGGTMGSVVVAQAGTITGQTSSSLIISPGGSGGTIRINGLSGLSLGGIVTAGANCSGVSIIQDSYSRIGDTVTFAIQIEVAVTAPATPFDILYTVPNAFRGTNFASFRGAGVAVSEATGSTAMGSIRSVNASKDLQFNLMAGTSVAGIQQVFGSGQFQAN